MASVNALQTESPLRDLEAIIRSRTPLIAMESTEEPQIVAEIEQAIVSAMYSARARQHNLTQEDLLTEIRQTRPLSVVMAEKVQETRDWAASRTVPCD